MVKVVLRTNESQEHLLKRFRTKVTRSKLLSVVKRKRFFTPKSELRRIEEKKAKRRHQRRQRQRTNM